MFVDIAKIYVKAGDGGPGAVAFHREKFVAAGGPDGGDGGKGGNVVFVVDNNKNTLLDFRYKRKYVAENGEKGGQKRCFGKDGKDIIIKVPRGTLIKDKETGRLIKDMSDDEPFIVCRGGKGGWGNAHFATPTRQVPRFAKPGIPGQEKELILELKLLADVGLVGFPNVGKSTLLSMVSAARPKIANYHFTTLEPNLGVVSVPNGESYVLADIPGIIEGASEGVGLGHDFLRHIDRCRLLIHVVDISSIEGRDPVEDFEVINQEMASYSEHLATRPQIVAGNKADIIQDEEKAQAFRAYIQEKGYRYFEISAASRQGVDELMNAVAEELSKLPPVITYESEPEPVELAEDPSSREITIRAEDHAYFVEGKWLLQLIGSINFGDRESLQYFQRTLKNTGVIEKLEAAGCGEGDTVVIYDIEFDFVK